MGRTKGTPKTGGRQKGTPNKLTSDFKSWIYTLIDRNRNQIKKDLKNMDPKDRLLILEKLMQYVIPKQQAVQTSIDYSRITDEQLNIIINRLSKEIIQDGE